MQNNIIVGKTLLETITSALYENPIILFREYVQNSLDAYNHATKIQGNEKLSDFYVDIKIDEKNRNIIITDNGYAIETIEKFQKDMLSLGDSGKTDRTQFIGFRGIGRISALPFCETLIFSSKAINSNKINICKWEGKTYRQLINLDTESSDTFEETIKKIVTITQEDCDESSDHFFKVEILNYGFEVEEVLSQENFTEKLKMLLPVRYKSDFSGAQKIIAKYKEFMNEELDDFMCPVTVNGIELFKNYTNANILDSDIIFWEIRGKSKDNRPGDKIGILWFTFNKKMVAEKESHYGIMVRSKNVLMGHNDTFADLCASSKDHVATYRELTTTLRGVYGELLINYDQLKDNARREWFRTDENSIYLKYIIVDFMRCLYNYRYKASQYYNAKSSEKIAKKKDELKNALIELVDWENNKFDVDTFYPEIDSIPQSTDGGRSSKSLFADEDIPHQSITRKRIYDEIMTLAADFFHREKMYDIFLKLRAFIKNRYSN